MKKKILITIFLIINLMVVLLPNKSNAVIPINTANLYAIEETGALFRKDGVGIFTTVVMYDYNGKQYPAYCLNKDLPGVTLGNSYSVTTDSYLTDVKLWRVAINGYPYKTCAELGCETVTEAFMATKQAIYCTLYGTDPNKFVPIGESGERIINAIKKILNDATASNAVKPSADLEISAMETAWKVDSQDKNYISREFRVSSNAPMDTYLVQIEGEMPEGAKITDITNQEKEIFNSNENFKILIPIKNILKDGNFMIKATAQVETKPVLYGKSGNSSLQDYAVSGIMYEEGKGVLKAYYFANLTKITILKQKAESKEPLEGAEFQILDENQNIIYSDLKTSTSGEIVVSNLLPGKYFVKEIKAVEGYMIYDKLIEIDLSLNESTKVIVNNSEKQVEYKEEKKETEVEVENKNKEIEVIEKEEQKETMQEVEVPKKIEEKIEKEEAKETKQEVETTKEPEEVIEKIEIKESTQEVLVKLPKTGM